MRQLEAVVPERHLARAQLLGLLPALNAVLFARSAAGALEDEVASSRDGEMVRGQIRYDHRVRTRTVLEEVIDPLFFHQAARERKVGLAVLDAEVAWMERAADLPGHVEGGGEDLLQDVGHRKVLKDAALRLPRQEESFRDEVEHMPRERGVPRSLRDPQAGPVDEALAASRQLDLDGDLLSQERVEEDLLGLLVLGDALELEKKGPGDRFLPREAAQKENVRTQRRRDLEPAAGLCVGHSAPPAERRTDDSHRDCSRTTPENTPAESGRPRPGLEHRISRTRSGSCRRRRR